MIRAPGLAAAPPVDTVLDGLLACHQRIRHFAGLAARLATADGSAAERVEAAAAVVRYFTIALPLHADDEAHSLAPRLLVHAPALDAALAHMTDDHADHAALLAPVVAACRAIAEDAAARPATLAADAGALIAAFAAHLALEEQTIFPALAALPDSDQAAIRAEMAARRR